MRLRIKLNLKKIRFIGIILILLGLVVNPFIVGQLFSPNNKIESSYYFVRIILFECFVIFVGIFVYLKAHYIFKKRREIGLFLIFSIICLLFLEIGARIYLCNFADYATQSEFLLYGQCGFSSRYVPHHYLNYQGTPGYSSPDGLNIHNSYGFRGPEITIPKPNETYRIVILGGSTVYTIGVDDWKKDFARQLQKELQSKYNYLGIEVINAGIPGYNSWESLINLEFKVLDLEPDLIIIYMGTNDVHARMVNPDYYFGDNSGRRRRFGQFKSFPLIYYSTFFRYAIKFNPSRSVWQFVDAPTTTTQRINTGFVDELNGTFMETLQKNKPVYFERNLKNIVAIAKEHNINILLSTWAYSNQFDKSDYYVTTPYYELGFKENNEVVKNVGESHNVLVYNFVSEMPMDKIYWLDGVHVNEEGVKLKGKLFADYIYSNKMIKDEIIKLKNAKSE